MQPSNHVTISVFCDGGSRGNPGPSACAFVLKDETGKTLHQEGKFLGTATNNIAEYQAVLLALNYLKNNKVINQQSAISNWIINFYLDSSLVVNQINGTFKVKNATLRELLLQINSQLLTLPCRQAGINSKLTFSHIPREQNHEADKLVNETLDKIVQK